MDGKEKTEVRDVKLAKASKLNQKDAMYISVIQQLMAKVDALEARIKKLEDG
jgi:cell division protein FtsB